MRISDWSSDVCSSDQRLFRIELNMRTHGRRIEKGRKIHCSGQILLNAGRRQEHWLASDRGSVVAGPPPSRLRASLGAALKPDGGENPALSWFDPADRPVVAAIEIGRAHV